MGERRYLGASSDAVPAPLKTVVNILMFLALFSVINIIPHKKKSFSFGQQSLQSICSRRSGHNGLVRLGHVWGPPGHAGQEHAGPLMSVSFIWGRRAARREQVQRQQQGEGVPCGLTSPVSQSTPIPFSPSSADKSFFLKIDFIIWKNVQFLLKVNT